MQYGYAFTADTAVNQYTSSHFTINANDQTIEKSTKNNGRLYQVVGQKKLDRAGTYAMQVQLTKIDAGWILFGIITENLRSSQYSSDKTGCVALCFKHDNNTEIY